MPVMGSFGFSVQILDEIGYGLKVTFFDYGRIVIATRERLPYFRGRLTYFVQATHVARSVLLH